MHKKGSTFISVVIIIIIGIIGFVKYTSKFMSILVIPTEVISYIHFKLSNIPNVMMYSGYFSLFSTIFSAIFSVCFVFFVLTLLLKPEAENYRFAKKTLVLMLVSGALIYSNFWAITKDKVYYSSPTTMGSISQYNYNNITNISINVTNEKFGGLVLKVDLTVNGNDLDLLQSVSADKRNRDEAVRDFIATLRNQYHVPVSVNKHGYTEYDSKINYLLSN